MAHSARPVDLDGVIEDFVLLSDQRKDDFAFELWRQHSNNVTLLAFVNCCYCQNNHVMVGNDYTDKRICRGYAERERR